MRVKFIAALAIAVTATFVSGSAAFGSSDGPGIEPMPVDPTPTTTVPPTPTTTVPPTPTTTTPAPAPQPASSPVRTTATRTSRPAPTPEPPAPAPAPEPVPEPEPVVAANCPQPRAASCCQDDTPWAQLAALFAGGLLGTLLVLGALMRRKCRCDDHGEIEDGETITDPTDA